MAKLLPGQSEPGTFKSMTKRSHSRMKFTREQFWFKLLPYELVNPTTKISLSDLVFLRTPKNQWEDQTGGDGRFCLSEQEVFTCTTWRVFFSVGIFLFGRDFFSLIVTATELEVQRTHGRNRTKERLWASEEMEAKQYLVLILFPQVPNLLPLRKKKIPFIQNDDSSTPKYPETRNCCRAQSWKY